MRVEFCIVSSPLCCGTLTYQRCVYFLSLFFFFFAHKIPTKKQGDSSTIGKKPLLSLILVVIIGAFSVTCWYAFY